MSHLPHLAKIQAFLTVAETLNFRRAAERLCVAQPALSRSIKQLEDQLGFKLFERSTRRVALTAAGELLFREATLAMQHLAKACEDARGVGLGITGRIMVAYTTFAATGPMSDIIIEFRKRYPQAMVSLRLLASPEQWEGFSNQSIDLGFILSNACRPPLNSIRVSSERLVALVPGNHQWATRKSITLSELASARLVAGTAQRWQGFRPFLGGLFERKGLVLNVAEEGDDLPVLLQLVRAGLGCTVLDASFISTLPPGICALEIKDADVTLDVSLAWREDNLSILATRFIEIAREVLPAI